MKYSLKWLKDYLQTDKTPQELGEMMVALGSDVEEVVSFPNIDEKIIAVKITNIEPHPNADKLRLPTVTDGKREITIVCGAPNIEVGQIVPLAQIGSRIGELEISEAEIRGVKSTGMLCSERELGLSDEHTGIKILSDDTELGTKVKDILGKDQIFELEITPNRGDLLSHFGLARDLSAKLGVRLEKSKTRPVRDSRRQGEGDEESGLQESASISSGVNVEIKSDNCSLYMARVISGVKVAESPDWLKERLIAVGSKPVNNIVDVTNYIMLDLGHPLHAFDKAKLTHSVIPSVVEGSKIKIEVKEIDTEMEVVTLDGIARAVLPGMLGIWDAEKPVAIAGVMGLKNSEVDENTTDIVLEAAVFNRKSIRKTAKLLNLKTEASARFERGVDDAGTEYAIDKAAKMIAEIAGGEIIGGGVAGEFEKKQKVKIDYEKINSYAGLSLTDEQIDQILKDLGFEIETCPVRDSRRQEVGKDDEVSSESASISNGVNMAVVPSWRHDIAIWQDLAEEIYRINGLDKINRIPLERLYPVRDSRRQEVGKDDKVSSESASISNGAGPSLYYKKEKIKDYLIEQGLDEAISYTFLSEADVTAAKLDLYPVRDSRRQDDCSENEPNSNSASISNGAEDLLEVANPVQEENRYLRNSLIPGLLKAVAKNPSFDDVELFELGSVFSKNEEWFSLGIVTSGKSAKPIEKIVESLCGRFGFNKDDFRIYNIEQDELKRFKIKKPFVMIAEAKIEDLVKVGNFDDLSLLIKTSKVTYRPISKYPPVKRDLAFLVKSDIPSSEIRNLILEITAKAVLVELFDEFESEKLGINKKSVAFHVWLEDEDKTLADEEADEIISKIISELREKFEAELRG